MAGLYVALIENGFDAAYLDSCTLLDLDVFTRAIAKRQRKQSSGDSSARRFIR
ncbi:MAG TPA: hypothetical protein VK163_12935 [Opitutaceae bacterium]|nr:hypothetical protein [Opitutaceae bacterium]